MPGWRHPPLFAPAVARFYRGMLVEVPLQLWALPGAPKPRDLHAVLANAYAGRPLVEVAGLEEAAAAEDPGCGTPGRQQSHEAVRLRQ